MESFFARFKNALVLITVLVVQVIGLAIQVRRPVTPQEPDGKRVFLLRSWMMAIISPIERAAQRSGAGIGGLWTGYIDLRHARQENEQLRLQVATLRLEQAAFSEDAIQGHRLQELMDFQQHYISKTVAAQVIGTSGSDLSRMLILDKGADYGLKPDMAVITPNGIVGKLRDVFAHTSQLLLLNDTTAGAGAILQSTRIRAIVRGTPTGRVQINNLTADSRIKVGETVLTSGGDMVFPRGLPIGIIESMAPDPDHQPYLAIVVKPAANLFQLEEVLIITGTQTGISPEAQHDLAQGAATAQGIAADDAKKASDLLSERLPSLHDVDPSVPDPTNPDAKPAIDMTNPGGAVPKPVPTLHPDRYSPNSAPPAADLRPGAPSSYTAPSTPQQEAPAPAPRRTPKPATPPSSTTSPEPQP